MNKRLEGLGVTAEQLSKANGEKIQAAFQSSNWARLEECCGAAGKDLHQLTIKAGLAK
jgi:hypothetical protein